VYFSVLKLNSYGVNDWGSIPDVDRCLSCHDIQTSCWNLPTSYTIGIWVVSLKCLLCVVRY